MPGIRRQRIASPATCAWEVARRIQHCLSPGPRDMRHPACRVGPIPTDPAAKEKERLSPRAARAASAAGERPAAGKTPCLETRIPGGRGISPAILTS